MSNSPKQSGSLNLEHSCKNCGYVFMGNFCNRCGEKAYVEENKKLIHFFEEGFHFLTHFEGTLLTTIKTIITRPGELSNNYCQGIRKRYFRPQSLFLLLVILYLVFPYFEGLNMKMYYYTTNDIYGSFSIRKIKETMIATGMTEKQLSEVFHAKGEKVSKFLLYIIIPFSALFFWMFYHKKRKFFYDHMVFAAEINSLYLLWGFLVFPLLTYILFYFFGTLTFMNDSFFGLVNAIVFCIYCYIATRRFFNLNLFQSLLFTVTFLFFHIFIVHIVYKFLLFLLVINQIN